MDKATARKLKTGTVVYYDDTTPRNRVSSYPLGLVRHVTRNGGVLVTPVRETFPDSLITDGKPTGPDVWWPYHRVRFGAAPSD